MGNQLGNKIVKEERSAIPADIFGLSNFNRDDADRLLANWGGGVLGASAKDYYASLHRVAYYGDHTRTIRHLAHLMGLNVVEEG